MVDPDPYFLNEAERTLKKLNLIEKICSTMIKAEEFTDMSNFKGNVILAIHIVYFLQNGGLKKVIDSVPNSIPIFLIMDDVNAVFTNIWKTTALQYHKRSILAHKIIQNLSAKKYLIVKSKVTSTIPNPLELEQKLQNHILSMLCYSDFEKLSKSSKENVYSILNDYTISGNINCENCCYEIIKKP